MIALLHRCGFKSIAAPHVLRCISTRGGAHAPPTPNCTCRSPAGGGSTSRSSRPGSTAPRRSRRPAAPRQPRCSHASRRHQAACTPVRSPLSGLCFHDVAAHPNPVLRVLLGLTTPFFLSRSHTETLLLPTCAAGGAVVPGNRLAGAAAAGTSSTRQQAGDVPRAAARAHTPGPHARGQGGRHRRGGAEHQVCWPLPVAPPRPRVPSPHHSSWACHWTRVSLDPMPA